MQISARYYKGVLELQLRVVVNSIEDLEKALSINLEEFEVTRMRIKAIEDYQLNLRLENAGYSKVYFDYSKNTPTLFVELEHSVIYQKIDSVVRQGIRELVTECSARDGRDFSKEGRDPAFYTLGTDCLCVYVGNELAGFRVYSIEDNIMNLYVAYVYPKYRKQGIYGSLLNAAFNICRTEKLDSLLVSTDVTDQPMHYILLKHGFIHKANSWIKV